MPVKYINVTIETCLPGRTLRKANSDSVSLTCECDYKRTSGSIISCETDETVILKVHNRSNIAHNNFFPTNRMVCLALIILTRYFLL